MGSFNTGLKAGTCMRVSTPGRSGGVRRGQDTLSTLGVRNVVSEGVWQSPLILLTRGSSGG